MSHAIIPCPVRSSTVTGIITRPGVAVTAGSDTLTANGARGENSWFPCDRTSLLRSPIELAKTPASSCSTKLLDAGIKADLESDSFEAASFQISRFPSPWSVTLTESDGA